MCFFVEHEYNSQNMNITQKSTRIIISDSDSEVSFYGNDHLLTLKDCRKKYRGKIFN